MRSEATKRRGVFWVTSAHNSPNWPLDEDYDEEGVSKHDLYEQWVPLLDDHVDYEAMNYLDMRYPELCEQLTSTDSPVELIMQEHLIPNNAKWIVERLKMELHLGKARQAMRALADVEQSVEKATNVMAELDWQHRDTDRFPFGPLAEIKRLATILTQKECGADWRLIEALEKQKSRTVRSIVVEHERRDFVESWRAFHHFGLAMFELLHETGRSPEELAEERCLVLRLAALERQGITLTYDHYGIEQHSDLEWGRARTYLARTRRPAPSAEEVATRPAWGMSRTRAHMYQRRKGKGPMNNSLDIEGISDDGEEHDDGTFIDWGDDSDEDGAKAESKPAASDLKKVKQRIGETIGAPSSNSASANSSTAVVAVEAEDQDMEPPPMATAAVVFLRPRVLRPLQLNAAEGTSLERTYCQSSRGIRFWLNTTKLYGPMLGVMVRWFHGSQGSKPRWLPRLASESSWLAWLNRHEADGTPDELLEVARDLKLGLGVDRFELERLRTGQGKVPQARLLSQAEYSAAEGDAATPMMGDDMAFDKVAASGRSSALLNLDWTVRNAYSSTALPPPTGYINTVSTSREAMVEREWMHKELLRRDARRKLKTVEPQRTRKLIMFMEQDATRVYNVNYLKSKLAFQHFKEQDQVKLYLHTPTGRYLESERKRRKALREDKRTLSFAGALSTRIHMLTPEPVSQYANPFADVYRMDGPEPIFVTEHEYDRDLNTIWRLPVQSQFDSEDMMDVS
jgi:hypothetical protein